MTMFNEKKTEWSAKQGKEIPVWQMPKYIESRKAAVAIIESGKYGLSESDFWILMNETKSGKMAYSGLIMSHNGCLKVNDALGDKFRAECVSINESGWGGSLVCFYNCTEQGLFEVGEVSKDNCKNAYPYAMAVKRLFDRVVLKLSKLAYSGIYGEDEADEFRNPQEEPKQGTIEDKVRKFNEPPKLVCENCGTVVVGYTGRNGKPVSADAHIAETRKRFGKTLCLDCAKRASNVDG